MEMLSCKSISMSAVELFSVGEEIFKTTSEWAQVSQINRPKRKAHSAPENFVTSKCDFQRSGD